MWRQVTALFRARQVSPSAKARTCPRTPNSFRTTEKNTLQTSLVETDPFLVTRRSLVERLANRDDQKHWQEFFETYWKLIYGFARKAGLNDAEAQDVVQETIITVSKKIDSLKYDPSVGTFKGWLLHITRWRIADQFRERDPAAAHAVHAAVDDDRRTATIERVPDQSNAELEAAWDAEWKANLLEAAMTRVKRRVDARQFQIFDCYVVKEWPAGKVAKELRVNIAQVYLARHRVAALIRNEVKLLEEGGC